MKRALSFIALVLVAELTAAGCGNDTSAKSASGRSFNDAD